MAYSVLFFRNEIDKVRCALADFTGASMYERGATSLLKQDCLILHGVLLQLTKSSSIDTEMTNIDDWAVDDPNGYIEDEEGEKEPEEYIEIEPLHMGNFKALCNSQHREFSILATYKVLSL